MNKLPFLFCLILFSSCGGKKESTREEDKLLGRWTIDEASRNGRKTTTLKDGYMTFMPEQQLETNILGSVTKSNFSIETDRIKTNGEFNYTFNIERFTTDSLVISGRMKVFNMVFYLTRDSIQPESPPVDLESHNHVN